MKRCYKKLDAKMEPNLRMKGLVGVMKKKFLRCIAILLCLGLLAGCSAKGSNKELESWNIQEKSFGSPEKAIEYYVGKIAENDFKGALEACATSSYVNGLDFAAQVSRAKSIILYSDAPSKSQFYKEINYAKRISDLASWTKMMVFSLVLPEQYHDLLEGLPLKIESLDQEKMDDLIKDFDPQKAKNLKIKLMTTPHSERMYSEKGIENSQKQAKVVGADEVTERVVLYELDGVYYYGGFRVLRYGKDWKIESLVSMYAGTSPFGTLTKIDDEDFTEADFLEEFH